MVPGSNASGASLYATCFSLYQFCLVFIHQAMTKIVKQAIQIVLSVIICDLHFDVLQCACAEVVYLEKRLTWLSAVATREVGRETNVFAICVLSEYRVWCSLMRSVPMGAFRRKGRCGIVIVC